MSNSVGTYFANLLLREGMEFHIVAQEIEGWFVHLEQTPEVQAQISNLKQQASQLLGLAGTAMGDALQVALAAVERAADAYVVTATGGYAVAAVPIVNAGLQTSFDILNAGVKGVEARAAQALAMPKPAPAPAEAPVVDQVHDPEDRG